MSVNVFDFSGIDVWYEAFGEVWYGEIVEVITPPFRIEAKDVFTSGTQVGMAYSQGAVASDSYAQGAVTGSSNG